MWKQHIWWFKDTKERKICKKEGRKERNIREEDVHIKENTGYGGGKEGMRLGRWWDVRLLHDALVVAGPLRNWGLSYESDISADYWSSFPILQPLLFPSLLPPNFLSNLQPTQTVEGTCWGQAVPGGDRELVHTVQRLQYDQQWIPTLWQPSGHQWQEQTKFKSPRRE